MEAEYVDPTLQTQYEVTMEHQKVVFKSLVILNKANKEKNVKQITYKELFEVSHLSNQPTSSIRIKSSQELSRESSILTKLLKFLRIAISLLSARRCRLRTLPSISCNQG